MTILEGLDFVITKMMTSFFLRFDSWMITDNVSVLGFSVAIGILVIIVGTIVMRV